jgi:pilus assembly protein Flp/PilA
MNIPQREEGQGLVEYALMLVLVAVVVIIILTILGSQVVFVFARVAGGLRGDVLDAANGDTAVLVNYEGSISGSGGSCAGNLTNVLFVVTDSSGQMLTEQNVTATVMVNGVSSGLISGYAGRNGLATSSMSVSGSCPLVITLE